MSIRAVVCLVSLLKIAAGQTCESPDFVNYCATQYGGASVGGRCFFLARNSSDKSLIKTQQWSAGFDICKNHGGDAIFAQIYSEKEMKAIWQTFQSTINTYSFVWIPLRNRVSVPSTPKSTPAMNVNDTHWCSDASTCDARFTINNTFLRNHAIDDDKPGEGECFVIYKWQGYIRIGDINCTLPEPRPTLCMTNNNNQMFTRTPGCFMEPAIQTEEVQTIDECAIACADHIWCRTFNYYCKTQNCALFALRADEATTSVSSSTAGCGMYIVDA